MACVHGLNGAWCALCNKAVLVREPFHARRRPEDEPRLRKGRDSAQWVGVGRNLDRPEHVNNPSLAELTTVQVARGEVSKVDKQTGENVITPVQVRVRFERIGRQADTSINPMGLSKGSCIRPVGSTAWGQAQALRSLQDALRKR